MKKNIVDVVYPERSFGGFTRYDGTVAFYSRVSALMQNSSSVLDIGCGRGKYADDTCTFRRGLCDLRGSDRRVIGIDVDEVGSENPIIDEFRIIENLESWPVDSASVDVAVANSVVEHVEDPDSFFQEAHRVLRPGGYLCIRTYNVWSYVGVASRLVPNRLHGAVTTKVQVSRREEDVFPTLYRCNTRGKLRKAFHRNGFDGVVYSIEAEPSYLRFSRMLYRIGAVVHRITPPQFRWTLLGFGRKLDGQSGP